MFERSGSVVLDRRDRRGHPRLAALEVYEPVRRLCPPPMWRVVMPRGCCAARLVQLLDERLLRFCFVTEVAREDRESCGPRRRLVTYRWHLDPLEQLYALAIDEPDHGLLPRRGPTRLTLALGLALHVDVFTLRTLTSKADSTARLTGSCSRACHLKRVLVRRLDQA